MGGLCGSEPDASNAYVANAVNPPQVWVGEVFPDASGLLSWVSGGSHDPSAACVFIRQSRALSSAFWIWSADTCCAQAGEVPAMMKQTPMTIASSRELRCMW